MDINLLPLQPKREPRYYIQDIEDKIMNVHAPHPRRAAESFCGEAGLVSQSPLYVVTCIPCIQLQRKENGE